MKSKKDLIDSINKLHLILDREIDELNASKREHHKSWDAHILTLSMASIGFVIVSLPIGVGDFRFVVYGSLIFFVLAIISALLGFLFADKGFEFVIKDHVIRRSIVQEVDAFLKDGCKGADYLDDDQEEIYRQILRKNMETRDAESVSSRISKINKYITILNQLKTYFFVFGIVLVSVFALINADKIGVA